MSEHSERGGRTRWASADVASGDGIDVAVVRHIFANNAAHFADCQPQVRINWSARSSSAYRRPREYLTTRPSFVTKYPIHLTRKPDGTTVPLVVRLRGAWANQTGTITFYVSLRPWGSAPFPPSGDHVSQDTITFSSSTPDWGDMNTREYLTLDEWQLRDASQVVDTKLDLSSNQRASVGLVMAQLEIWASSTGPTVETRLFGVYAQEYIGP